MKRCSGCGLKKEPGEFYKDKRKPDGLYHRCKSCHLESCAKFRKNNPEVGKKWREQNRNYLSVEKRLDYLQNKDKYNSKNREWALSHKDELKVYNKNYCSKNRERLRKQKKQYRKKNILNLSASNIIYQRLTREQLHDGYLKALLRRQFNCDVTDKKIIEVKRKQLKLKRIIDEKREKFEPKNVAR